MRSMFCAGEWNLPRLGRPQPDPMTLLPGLEVGWILMQGGLRLERIRCLPQRGGPFAMALKAVYPFDPEGLTLQAFSLLLATVIGRIS